MKTVDKMQILQSQSAEFIEQGETGKFLKLIPDTFIIKGSESEHGTHQGYAIRHINRKDIILIDVVESSTKEAVKKLVEDGYTIKGILISNNLVYKSEYADVKTMSQDAGGASIFMHPRITPKNGDKVKDITARHDIIKNFGLTISDLPGSGGGSVLIYSEINDGMLFTGADAEGSPYDSYLNTFTRPKLESKNDEYGLAQAWGAFVLPFAYIFPLCGKPGFNLDEGKQQDILMKLSRIQE